MFVISMQQEYNAQEVNQQQMQVPESDLVCKAAVEELAGGYGFFK